MKTYKESILSYKCTGCGATVYNATHVMDKCPECGYSLKKVNKKVKDLKK
jgi:predicted RNA-binding Zn-ribbon protein involved in translation (DUF1610 family)